MQDRKKNTEFTHIKALLRGHVKEASKSAAKGLMHVVELWESSIDPSISANSKPESLKNGVLTLKVLSPAWSQQILFLKKNLIRTINSGLDSEIVSDIKCRVTSYL